jgi:hypothetical protein
MEPAIRISSMAQPGRSSKERQNRLHSGT